MISTPKLKIIIEEKIKTHERAKDCIRYNDQEQVEIRIAVYKQILGIINGPNGEEKESVSEEHP